MRASHRRWKTLIILTQCNFHISHLRDKDCFKLRSSVEKCVVISLCQVSDNLTSLKVDNTVWIT